MKELKNRWGKRHLDEVFFTIIAIYEQWEITNIDDLPLWGVDFLKQHYPDGLEFLKCVLLERIENKRSRYSVVDLDDHIYKEKVLLHAINKP